MKRRISATILMALLASLLVALPALAAAPSTGTVYEGLSVPGVALGDARASVLAAYGDPQWCQSVEVRNDYAFCSFPAEGGGQVDIRFRGPDGGNASNSPNDIVHAITWTEPVSGWTTTAGVNTALAAADPDAVVAAYPDAEVVYNAFGFLYRVTDYAQGFEVIWSFNPYTGTTSISAKIFNPPSDPPPPPPPPPGDDETVVVASIDLDFSKTKGNRTVTAVVNIADGGGQPAPGAEVSAHWLLPNGSVVAADGVSGSDGSVVFELDGVKRGTHTLVIEGVGLAGHEYDPANSVTSASIEVK